MPKSQRREVRLTTEEDDLIVEAAGLSGVSVSEFVLTRAVNDAERLVNQHHSITFTGSTARERFIAALDAPFMPNETLAGQVSRARRYKTVD